MSENKFIAKLKGVKSAKSVVEVQDPKAKKSFTGIAGTSDSPQGYSLDTASSVVVANGAKNWTCGYGTLTQSADYRGDGSDYTGSWNADGAGLWMNATYTFPASDDPSNSTVAIINPNAKWVLTLFGARLLSDGANVVKLKLVVQIGAKNIASKDFVLPVHAFQFCEQLAVDFTESTTEQIKVDGGTQLNVQLLCEDENAHAQIFSGMTVLTLLDRKIDARDVASDKTSFDDLEKRVTTNAQAIDVIESKIPDNASPTNKMATAAEISNLQTQITSNDNDIVNLQTQITSNDTDIANLQSTKADKTTDFQTPITSANKGATMAEITALDNDLQAQITSNDADILKNTQDITALKGAGGALNASNFNTATPTQETLTKYAVDQIWVGNTNWAWNAANPAASTFTDANGVARTAAEIFNSTWVNNTYDDHRWQLTNTQNTTPKVFEWADVGRDIVSVATATTAGIVRVGSGSQMVVNPTTGDISLNGAKAAAIRTTIGAPGLSTENEYTDNAIYPLQKGIILQGANGEKYTIRTDGSSPSGFIIYEGKSSANTILSFQPSDQNTVTIGNISYRIKAGSSASLTSNDETVATTQWVRAIITEQMGGDFVQYWDSGDATDHSHAKPGVATPASGTWYRLYKSGWVEQGVTTPTDSTNSGGVNDFSFAFPIPMKSSAYTIGAGGPLTINNVAGRYVVKTTTGVVAGSQQQTVRCSNIVVFGWAA